MPAIFQTGIGAQVNSVVLYANRYWGDARVNVGPPLLLTTNDRNIPPDITADVPYINFLSSRWRQDPAPAIGDELEWDISLTPGNYLFSVWGFRSDAQGIISFALDGSQFLSADWYDPAPESDFVILGGPITTTNENMILTSTVTGNNAASSDYFIDVTRFIFEAIP